MKLIKNKVKEFEGLVELLENSEQPLDKNLIKHLKEFTAIVSEESKENYYFTSGFINAFKEEIIADLNIEQQLVKINDNLFLIKGMIWIVLILEN